jgi:pimeloyl-ACP methyl ester carboxylesterase
LYAFLWGWWAVSVYAYQVVIIPGMGGSVLRHGDKKVWPPFPSVQPSRPLDLSCDEENGCKSLLPLRTLPLGSLDGIRVDSAFTYMLTKNSFYYPLIQRLQKNNATVHALPYDFRLMNSPQIGDGFKAFFESRNEPVAVVCHSLGGLLFHDFLVTHTDAAWQKKHLSKIYFLNVPFGGCPDALYAILRSRLEAPVQVPFLNFRADSFHHFAGLYWCLPVSDAPVLRRQNGSSPAWYQGTDTDRLFADLSMGVARSLCRNLSETVMARRRKPIHTRAFVVYGTRVNTTAFMDWDTKTCLFEDGDGVVPLHSLLRCREYYENNQTHYVRVVGMEHGRLTDCLPLFDFIGNNSLPHRDFTFMADHP